MKQQNYYEVEAKAGHVSRSRFLPIKLYIMARDAKEAAAKARVCPRVKHDQKDAILRVTAVSAAEFQAGNARNAADPYFMAKNVQQQRACGDLYARTLPDPDWHSRERPEKMERRTMRERNLKKYQKFCGLYC